MNEPQQSSVVIALELLFRRTPSISYVIPSQRTKKVLAAIAVSVSIVFVFLVPVISIANYCPYLSCPPDPLYPQYTVYLSVSYLLSGVGARVVGLPFHLHNTYQVLLFPHYICHRVSVGEDCTENVVVSTPLP
jgi:hypothetical protein